MDLLNTTIDFINELGELFELTIQRSKYIKKIEKIYSSQRATVVEALSTKSILFPMKKLEENTKVAIKKVNVKNLIHLTQMIGEIKNLCFLRNHANFVDFYQIFYRNSTIFIIYEYIDSDLQAVIDYDSRNPNNKILDVSSISFILINVLNGLKFLHSKGFFHGSLVADNILISENKTVKLCGSGKIIVGISKLENQNIKCCPPELLFNNSDLLKRETKRDSIDMWSVGCILAQMLQLKYLFEINEPKNILRDQMMLLGCTLQDAIILKKLLPNNLNIVFPICESKMNLLFCNFEHITFYKFIKSLLVFDPEKRSSAEEILNFGKV